MSYLKKVMRLRCPTLHRSGYRQPRTAQGLCVTVQFRRPYYGNWIAPNNNTDLSHDRVFYAVHWNRG